MTKIEIENYDYGRSLVSVSQAMDRACDKSTRSSGQLEDLASSNKALREIVSRLIETLIESNVINKDKAETIIRTFS